ncbi:hypothetical protein OC846_000747 [Tilletia horrida]|uniref:Integral membrane bound transporter domain-containing protein n=1 Tax=Tilletia horrida TaxID=155126 RepID=A0AAN6GXP2_9BASI|nr:hypothetical protein OC845_001015 [Tilletia horrida]KAK0557100.1 hypothetical protein OC846_000747 [Tilletia horrida]
MSKAKDESRTGPTGIQAPAPMNDAAFTSDGIETLTPDSSAVSTPTHNNLSRSTRSLRVTAGEHIPDGAPHARATASMYGALDAAPSSRTPHSRSVSAQELRLNQSQDTSTGPPSALASEITRSSSRQKLWKAVNSSISAANAFKHIASGSAASRGDANEQGRVDAEGLSGTLRPLSGNYADHWQSLAHLFEPQSPAGRNATAGIPSTSASHILQNSLASGGMASPPTSPRHAKRNPLRTPTQSISNTTQQSRILSSTSDMTSSSILSTPASPSRQGNPSATSHDSISAPAEFRISSPRLDQHRESYSKEPETMLCSDPDHIPDGADPLEYADGDDLLDDDSEEEDEENEYRQSLSRKERQKRASWPKRIAYRIEHFFAGEELSLITKGVVKCAIAYYIAELFTFSEVLSDWIASLLPNHDPDAKVPFSNLHMIATVAVYFHPAKTIGAMLEADIFALLAFLYSIALGVSSMAAAVWLHGTGHPVLSNALSVLLFLGVGMGLVGYAKVKIGKPTFNTACSMIGVIVFTVIAKEGSAHLGLFSTDKIWQVSIVVIAGTLVSNAACFLIWPQSACTNLQEDIVRNLSGFSTLVKVLTKTFLLDDPSQFHYNSDRIKRAIDNHHASFISLRKNLQEARLEAPLDARMRHVSDRYVKVVDSMNRLAQHLTGLRSSCGLQHQIMVDRKIQEAATLQAGTGSGFEDPFADPAKESDDLKHTASEQGSQRLQKLGSETLKARASSFEHFASNIGPHMRSLVFTCTRTLRRARGTFELRALPSFHIARNDRRGSAVSLASGEFTSLIEDLAAALRRFQVEQTVSIKRMYTLEPSKTAAEEMKRRATVMARLASLQSEQGHEDGTSERVLSSHLGEAAARYGADINPDEEVFLVFFFVFNLEEFAKEISVLLRELAAIRTEEERMTRNRVKGWWKFWTWEPAPKSETVETDAFRRYNPPASLVQRLFRRGNWRTTPKLNASFPSSRPHQLDTVQTPRAQTFRQKLQRVVWSVGELLRQPDTKFAIKTGLGAAALAAPAFISATRPVFTEYQGQWALVSFMVVLSPTVGQSNQMSLHRVVGTIFGALVAYGAYAIFPDNNVALPIIGVIFSLPCFYYIVAKPQYASSARFVLLTYNLTALYSYNLRIVGVEVENVAFHRTVAVIIGVTWASLLNHVVWPFEARRELGLGISDLLFKLAWLYQRLVLTYSSQDASAAFDEDEDVLAADAEIQPLLRSNKQNRVSAEFQAM